jgi:alpha-L-fucosidase
VDATPFKRDPIRELKQACDGKGVRLGYYYSHSWDWHEPDALGLDNTWDFPDRSRKDFSKYLRGKSLPQVEELLTRYEPAVLWFDVPKDMTPEYSRWFLDLIRSKYPDCVVNSRIGNDLGDYDTPEQFIPAKKPGGVFEVCMTMNNHWGFDRNDHNWKSPETVIRNLVDIVGKGGNYLLNVGPTAEGVFPVEAVRLLREVGGWMKVNGESIYGTDAGPFAQLAWGRCTLKADRLYLHVFDWPSDGRLVVPGLKANVTRAYLLADPSRKPLKVARLGPLDMVVEVSDKPLDPIDTVVVLEYQDSVVVDPSLVVVSNVDNVLAAQAATCHGKKLKYVPNRFAMPNAYLGSWTEPADRASWKFRTVEPGEYEVVVVYGADAAHEGNTFIVEVAGTTLEGKVGITGDNATLQPFKLGTANIPGPGTHELVVRPARLNGKSGLMELSAVKLVPVRH